MFDLAKLSVTNSNTQSLVKDFEMVESYFPTLDDLRVSWIDSLQVTALTAGFLLPIGAVAWWQGYSCLGIVGVVAITTGAMALRRYDRTTHELFGRQRFASGKVAWEKNQSSSASKQKAEVRFVSSRSYTDMSVVDDVLKSDILSYEQMIGLAQAVLGSGKFNQDMVCKGAKISASDYGRLSTEMVEQGVIALKENGQKGFNITKRGYELLGHLVTPPTPLLS